MPGVLFHILWTKYIGQINNEQQKEDAETKTTINLVRDQKSLTFDVFV